MSTAKINSLVGRTFEYMTKEIIITGWTIVDGKYIFATQQDPISVDESSIDIFISSLIEIGNNAVQVAAQRQPVRLSSVPADVSRKIVDKMSAMLDEISEAKTPEEINHVTKKAKALSNAANTITNLGKLELEAIRMNRSTK